MTETAGSKNGGKLLHAYIITGGSAAAREKFALTVAKNAVCAGGTGKACGECAHCRKADKGLHPDIAFVEKLETKTELTVDVIRGVRSEAFVMPNEAERKVYIIRDTDIMNEEAQNAFLKILEEPPAFVVFLLLAENAARLLPTVRSRCAVMTVRAEERELSGEAEDFLAVYERGNKAEIAAALVLIDKMDKLTYARFADDLKRGAVARIKRGGSAEKYLALIDAVSETEKYQTVNVGRVHVSGLLIARLV